MLPHVLAALVLTSSTTLGGTLQIDNRSQFVLLELRIHDRPGYDEATNVLAGELALEEGIQVDFHAGQYVTAIREKVRQGDRFALTTGQPLDVPRTGARLEVFDESFRLYVPETFAAADQASTCSAGPGAAGIIGFLLVLASTRLRRRRRRNPADRHPATGGA